MFHATPQHTTEKGDIIYATLFCSNNSGAHRGNDITHKPHVEDRHQSLTNSRADYQVDGLPVRDVGERPVAENHGKADLAFGTEVGGEQDKYSVGAWSRVRWNGGFFGRRRRTGGWNAGGGIRGWEIQATATTLTATFQLVKMWHSRRHARNNSKVGDERPEIYCVVPSSLRCTSRTPSGAFARRRRRRLSLFRAHPVSTLSTRGEAKQFVAHRRPGCDGKLNKMAAG